MDRFTQQTELISLGQSGGCAPGDDRGIARHAPPHGPLGAIIVIQARPRSSGRIERVRSVCQTVHVHPRPVIITACLHLTPLPLPSSLLPISPPHRSR